jgi:hypothetical protein
MREKIRWYTDASVLPGERGISQGLLVGGNIDAFALGVVGDAVEDSRLS